MLIFSFIISSLRYAGFYLLRFDMRRYFHISFSSIPHYAEIFFFVFFSCCRIADFITLLLSSSSRY